MPSPQKKIGSTATKPTRSSTLRQSLNLASVGRAFSSGRHKGDSKDKSNGKERAKEKAVLAVTKDDGTKAKPADDVKAKVDNTQAEVTEDGTKSASATVANANSKETIKLSSRHSSSIGVRPPAPRSSLGDTRTPMTTKRMGTPDSKNVSRRRVSAGHVPRAMSVDESASKVAVDTPRKAATLGRSTTLRAHPTGSALPKYRPRSVPFDRKRTPSPVRVGTRRPFQADDEDEIAGKACSTSTSSTGNDDIKDRKAVRPISPLPQRALRVNLTSAINISPPTKATPVKGRPRHTPSPPKASPANRPNKLAKTSSTSKAPACALPRPTSRATPDRSSPRTPNRRKAAGLSPESSHISDSPLAKHAPIAEPEDNAGCSSVGNMSHISEADTENEDDEDEEDEEDVAFLLAPVASLGAPTPAMPRIINRSRRNRSSETPSRQLDSKDSGLSELQTRPSELEASPSPFRMASDHFAPRASILSWDEVAAEASRTLGEDEISSMLADIPAPFRSGATSPVPPSPTLSALNTPAGYVSISQVLLPAVTPSPAPLSNTNRHYDERQPSAGDSATATLLRLQLVAMENIAKERLERLQALEEELHNMREARRRETEELSGQVAQLEESMSKSVQTQEERMGRMMSLEEQLRQARELHAKDMKTAVEETRRVVGATATVSVEKKCQALWSARVAAVEWSSVKTLAESELDAVKSNQTLMSVLLAHLDEAQRRVVESRTP